MGRSAKFAKRPTKKEKAVSKTAKDSRKPLPPPPPPRQAEEHEEGEGSKGPKKRRMMRAKVDQVCSSCEFVLQGDADAPETGQGVGASGRTEKWITINLHDHHEPSRH